MIENNENRLRLEINALKCIFTEADELLLNERLSLWINQENCDNLNDFLLKVRLDEREFYSMPLYLEFRINPKNNYETGIEEIKVVSTKLWDKHSIPFFLSDSQCDFIINAARNAYVCDTECIYDQIIAGREATKHIVKDIPIEKTFENDSILSDASSDVDKDNIDNEIEKYVWDTIDISRTIRWGQRACYSHHIRSKIKRKLIIEWAHELYLGGFCKIGYPGIIIVEGPEECCLEYLRRLQRLRWKHFVVRGEIVDDVVLPKSSPSSRYVDILDNVRKLPNKMIEIPSEHIKDLAKNCEELGIKDLFLTTMKIYSK